MMIEAVAQFDTRKKISIAALVILGLVFICYVIIIRTPIAKLAAASQKRDDLLVAYAGTETERADYTLLQTKLSTCQEQLDQQKQRCFGPDPASDFFNNINAMAKTCNLEPLKSVVVRSADVRGQDAEPGQNFLERQSARVEVAGDYFDILSLIRELGNRPQKVMIEKMSIQLPQGEEINPTAGFEVACLINLEPEVEQ